MKHLLTLLITLAGSLALCSQYSISGYIKNENNNPIEFAQVYLENTDYNTETDENGYYKIENIEMGNYTLKVYLLGFEPFDKQLFIDKNLTIEVVLKEKTYNLKEIEINALKVSEKMPFAYKNISKKQIQDNNYGEDVPYLLQNIPSVVTTSDAGAGIGYTGLRIRGTDPTRINVTINGIPLNDAESQLVYWVDLPDISGSTDNIQVQRGVGTSTNGAGAFGASINLNTESVHPKPYLSLEGSYGSYNTSKISAKAGTGIMNEKYSVDVRYTSIKSDGYIDRASSALNSFFFSGTRFFENSLLKFNAIIGKEKTYQAWYGVPIQFMDTARTFNLAGTDYFSKQPPYENQVDDYSQNHFQLFYNTKLNETTLLNLATHFTKGSGFYEQYKVNEDLIDYNLDTSNYKTSDLIRQKWLDNDFYGLVYSFKKQFETGEFIIGGAANNYAGDHFGRVVNILNNPDYDGTHIYYKNTAFKRDFNIYSKYLYNISNTLDAFMDIQYRLVSYKINGSDDDAKDLDISDKLNFFNPKFGFKFSKNRYMFYSSFSVANKEPNRVDYINQKEGEFPKPERLYDFEAGTKYRFNNWGLELNFYNMFYRNQLVLTGKLDDVGNAIRENVKNSYRRGIELELGGKINNFISFDGNVTLSRNKISEYSEYISNWDSPYDPVTKVHKNTDISFSPTVIGGAKISFDLMRLFNDKKQNHFNLNIFQKYVGKQYLDNTMNESAKLAPYQYTNMSLEYKIKNDIFTNFQISFKINNIFNQKYITNGWVARFKSDAYNPIPDDPYVNKDSAGFYQYIGVYPQALRNFMVRIKVEF